MEKKFFEEVVAAMAAEGYKVLESSSLGVNVVKRGLQLKEMNSKEAPSLAVDVSFDEYFSIWQREGIGIVVCRLLEVMKESAFSKPEERQKILASAVGVREEDSLLQGVFLQVINAEKNGELLRQVPHRLWHDLAVIYRYVVLADDNIGSIIVKKNMLPAGLDEEMLYAAAYVNTKERFPFVVKPLMEIVSQMDEEELEQECCEAPMLMLSNSCGINGASVLLYPGVLKTAAAKAGCKKLFLLPSSLHEIIAVPYEEGREEQLLSMVYCINRTQLEPRDFLSDSIYSFDAETLEIRMFSAKDDCAEIA